eukprot:c37348_g1_i1 orf=2-160(-)
MQQDLVLAALTGLTTFFRSLIVRFELSLDLMFHPRKITEILRETLIPPKLIPL